MFVRRNVITKRRHLVCVTQHVRLMLPNSSLVIIVFIVILNTNTINTINAILANVAARQTYYYLIANPSGTYRRIFFYNFLLPFLNYHFVAYFELSLSLSFIYIHFRLQIYSISYPWTNIEVYVNTYFYLAISISNIIKCDIRKLNALFHV